MQKLYYTAASLDSAVQEFEREYGMTSADFHARWTAEEPMEIPRFEQHVWASFYEDVQRLTDGHGVERRTVTERAGRALVCQ